MNQQPKKDSFVDTNQHTRIKVLLDMANALNALTRNKEAKAKLGITK